MPALAVRAVAARAVGLEDVVAALDLGDLLGGELLASSRGSDSPSGPPTS